MRTSSNDIRRGNMGIHQPGKEQASSRTNKDGKKYVKHTHRVRKRNIWVREEKKKVTERKDTAWQQNTR